ncbi:MAG: twin-arginine translocation signal domain-containing protein, partial [Kiloniellales bacterium]|nr:twin-arginine translocation signal domain-containing protein [Kiloniellales bacterium]
MSAVSRRRFLQASAITGALGGLAPALLTRGAMAQSGADGEVLTGSHWGAFHAKVEDGRFVAIRPWEGDPSPSPQL